MQANKSIIKSGKSAFVLLCAFLSMIILPTPCFALRPSAFRLSENTPTEIREAPVSGIILDNGISQDALNQETGFRITEAGIAFGNWWQVNNTTIFTIDKAFMDILGASLIEQIKDLAIQKASKGELLYILDWGAGNLAAAKSLAIELEKEGLINFRIITYADVYVKSTGTIPDNIIPIVGLAENLSQHLKDIIGDGRIDFIYSFVGVRYLYASGNSERFIRHIGQLSALLSDEAKVVFNGFTPAANYFQAAKEELSFKQKLAPYFKNVDIKAIGQNEQHFMLLEKPIVLQMDVLDNDAQENLASSNASPGQPFREYNLKHPIQSAA